MPCIENLTVFAPAKVNLHLSVKNRREDGFHDLESLFLALNFGDLLHFELVDGDSVEIIMEYPILGTGSQPVPMLDNIIYKAINLFQLSTGFSQGLKVRVEKRIPIGGGLGGGSSNAAATLLALNKILKSSGEAIHSQAAPLSRQALLEMAAALGSDVPFFIHETVAAKVSGRGDIIEPVEMPPMFLVLVNPGFASDTARAFRLLDKKRIYHEPHKPHEPVLRDISLKNFDFPFHNDFINVFSDEEKAIYNEIISALQVQGAQYANLSGSGATCFGVYDDEVHARKAVDALREKWDFVESCSSKSTL